MPTQSVMARSLAHAYHEGQTRRDGVTPYTEHLRRVAESVREYRDNIRPAFEDSCDRQLWENFTDLYVATAWLHDILEDTDATQATLEEFGIDEWVIRSVRDLTKKRGQAYQKYLATIADRGLMSWAKLVKTADILDNLLDDPTPRQIAKYRSALLFLAS